MEKNTIFCMLFTTMLAECKLTGQYGIRVHLKEVFVA